MRILLVMIILTISSYGPSSAQSGDEVNIVEVHMMKKKFVPENITISPGTTIRWINTEKIQYHSVIFEQNGMDEDSEYLFPGETFELKFDSEGDFPYRCGPHPEMIGNVTVNK